MLGIVVGGLAPRRRVTFTAPADGTCYASASGDRDETGSYTLSVQDVDAM